MKHTNAIHVAVAVIVSDTGEVLIAKRPDHVHQGGLWEFPGGKIEPNENTLDALKRELHEELGIEVQQTRPLIQLHHDYPDKSVYLDVCMISHFTGTPHGREGQAIQWVAKLDLNNYKFPTANAPIIHASQLPDRYLITPEPVKDLNRFLNQLERSLQKGVRLVQLRAKKLSIDNLITLGKKTLTLCQKYDATLLINDDPQTAKQIDAHGVHLTSQYLMKLRHRPLDAKKWVAASCHNQAEFNKANEIGVDFAVAGSVLPTQSHPNIKPMGWSQFKHLCGIANFPVYALGGMKNEFLQDAWRNGGQGIAGISLFMESS